MKHVHVHDYVHVHVQAHLVNFGGSDTMPGLCCLVEYYGWPLAMTLGTSIPAAEHSTITSWTKEGGPRMPKSGNSDRAAATGSAAPGSAAPGSAAAPPCGHPPLQRLARLPTAAPWAREGRPRRMAAEQRQWSGEAALTECALVAASPHGRLIIPPAFD